MPRIRKKRLVADNLFPIEAFRRMAWHMVLSPIWLAVTSLPIVMYAVGVMRPEFNTSFAVHILTYGLRLAIWGAVLILALPPLASRMMRRNVPFILCYLALLVPCLVVANLVTMVADPGVTLEAQVLRFCRQFSMGCFLTVILMLVIQSDVRALGSDPDLVPVWWPVSPRLEDHPNDEISPAAEISLLEAGLSGRILSIQAQNQYVEVATPERSHLLRMPFHVALARMPHASGHRVHRSWWLANDLPVALRKSGQNHEVLDARGRVYPVSRPNLDLVRSLVERNAAATRSEGAAEAEAPTAA